MSVGGFGPGFGPGFGGFGGFGHPFGFGGFGSPFFNPFFFPRRFSPFFFLSPFSFPFFRGEDDRDGEYFTEHQCTHGDTMIVLAQKYNVPRPVLEAMNPHIQNPNVLTAGIIVYIPRMDKMFCHKMYLEHEMSGPSQQTMPYTGATYPMSSGQQQQMGPYSYPCTQTS